MKPLMTAMLIFSLAAQAQASGPKSIMLEDGNLYQANLEVFRLDPQYKVKAGLHGSVSVDLLTDNVRLSVYQRPVCKPGQPCPALIRTILDAELPIISVEQNDCGVTVAKARRDLRLVDGGLEEITVRDNRTNMCPTFVALPATSVKYHTESSAFNVTHESFTRNSSMDGSELEEVNPVPQFDTPEVTF